MFYFSHLKKQRPVQKVTWKRIMPALLCFDSALALFFWFINVLVSAALLLASLLL
jgi:hypothetical protein